MKKPNSQYTHPKAKKRIKRPEQLLQIGIMNFARRLMEIEKYRTFMIYHTPNGGGRSKAEAGIFKSMGVMAGVADLTVLIPPNTKHDYPLCLFIELKADGEDLLESQIKFEDRATYMDFPYYIIEAVDANDALTQWIQIMAKHGVKF